MVITEIIMAKSTIKITKKENITEKNRKNVVKVVEGLNNAKT